MDATQVDREVQRAQALIDLRRFDEASEVLARLIAASPDSARLHCLFAQCRLGAKDYPGAKEAAGRALASDPRSEHALRLAAIAAGRLGDAQGAVRFAERAVEVTPDGMHALLALSDALRGTHDLIGAANAARRAVAVAPERARPHLALALVSLDARKPSVAETHCRKALELDPDDTSAVDTLAVALAQQGRRDEAIHYFGEVAQRRPDDDRARQNAARLAEQTPVVWRLLILGAVVIGWPVLAIIGGQTPWALLPIWGVAVFGLWRTVRTLLTRNAAAGDARATWRQRSTLIRQKRRETSNPWTAKKVVLGAGLVVCTPFMLIVAIVVGSETFWPIGVALFAAYVAAAVLLARRFSSDP